MNKRQCKKRKDRLFRKQLKELNFTMNEIYSQSMNWDTGVMTINDMLDGEMVTTSWQAIEPNSPFAQVLRHYNEQKTT